MEQITNKNHQATSTLKADNDELSPNYLQNASQIIASYEQNITEVKQKKTNSKSLVKY